VEEAYRPVYKWEHDAIRANLSGASQKLEANTFDELRGLEHCLGGEQSGKAEEEEFVEEAELLLSEEGNPAPATASKVPQRKTKRVSDMVPRHIKTGKLITCQKMDCNLAAQMKTKTDTPTSPWVCEIHEIMQNDGIGYQQIFKDGRLVKVEHVHLVDKLEAVCVLNGCAHYTKRAKAACCEEHRHLHASGLTLHSDSDSEAEYQPANTIPRLNQSYIVVKQKIGRVNEELRSLQKGKDDQISKYNKARKLQIAGVHAHAKQLGADTCSTQDEIQAVVKQNYAELDDHNEYVWTPAHEDQYRLLASEAQGTRGIYNERMQTILLQLKLGKSAATAHKEAKSAAIAAVTKEERARIPVQQTYAYRERNRDAGEKCILRKCTQPSTIEEIITRDDGTKEVINVCSIDHLNEYIQRREEHIRWQAQQAKKASQQLQGGAKKAKKAALSLVYTEAHPDMFDDENEDDLDHYEDDPDHPWLVPEGRGDSWQGDEDEDSDDNDGDRTVPSFTEPGDFDLGDDEEEDEDEHEHEDVDEEEELPQRPVHVDRPERVRQDFRIRDFCHEVLKKCLMIGTAIRLGKKNQENSVSAGH
jgi:hypothetical protein